MWDYLVVKQINHKTSRSHTEHNETQWFASPNCFPIPSTGKWATTIHIKAVNADVSMEKLLSPFFVKGTQNLSLNRIMSCARNKSATIQRIPESNKVWLCGSRNSPKNGRFEAGGYTFGHDNLIANKIINALSVKTKTRFLVSATVHPTPFAIHYTQECEFHGTPIFIRKIAHAMGDFATQYAYIYLNKISGNN